MGNNYDGQLGDGTTDGGNYNTNLPEQIVASGATAIAAGVFHTLFLKSDDSLWAMGYNNYGQLGDGTYNQINLPEQIVASNVTAIAAGVFHSLFLKSDGSLWAMGDNGYGQLGDGTHNSTNRPEQIVASGVTAIAAGWGYSLFLKSDGSLWTMGYNYFGQLGDGTHNSTNLPEQIVASNVTAIAAGSDHSLFLKSDGSLWAMGYNADGQLGDGTYNTTNQPEQIVSSNVTAIAAGGDHSLFLKSDGSLWAMGYNEFGVLGDGTYNYNTNLPEQIVAGPPVNPLPLTVTVNNQSRSYGTTNPSFTGTVTGVQNGDNITATFSCSATAASPVANYLITVSLIDPANKLVNYSVTTNNGVLTVTQAVLAVSADNYSRPYGATNPVFTATYTGFVNGENTGVLTGLPSLTTTTTNNSPVGDYTIAVTNGTLNATNYSLLFTNGTLTINQAALTVTLGITANNKVYDGTTTATIGSNNIVLNGVLAGDTANVWLSMNSYTANFTSANVGTGIGVTVSGLTLTGSAAGNYTLTQPTGLTANIGAAVLTYTANAAVMTYGSGVPGLSGSVSGFVGTDNQGNATTGILNFTTGATSSSGVGSYAINGSGLVANNGNYTFVQALGNATALTINALAVDVTGTRVYDGTAAVSAGILSVVNKVGSDNVTVASGSGSLAGANVGPEAITSFGTLSLGGAAAGNYTLLGGSGTVSITAGGLVVTNLLGMDKVYDGSTNATLNGTNAGLAGVMNGDSVTLVVSNAVADFADKKVGTNKPVRVTGLGLGGVAAGNYALVDPTNVTANITAAGLSVSGVTAVSKVYDGTAVAQLSGTAELNGQVSGDDVSLVSSNVMAAFAGPNVGSNLVVTVSGYAISGADAGNYTLTQPEGLTANITSKVVAISSVPSPAIISIHLTNGVVTITWNSVGGGSYRVQYINDLSGGGWTDLSPDVTATAATATQTDAVGSAPQRFYRIKVLNPGITANNKVYDGTTTATISSNNIVLNGVLAGDTANVWLSMNSYTANFTIANVGTGIGVTVSGLTLTGSAAGNYTLTQPTGLTANITPATLTVSANNKSRTYGLPNPPLTVSYSGFVNSEGTNVLTGTPSLNTSATTNSLPGTYTIIAGAGTLNATNYNFAFFNGTLTVVALPRLSNVLLNGNQFILAWPTVAGQTYQLEYKDNLSAATWILSGSFVGTGNPIIATNNLGASPQRFFRLEISP
jgi:hypothetical protein